MINVASYHQNAAECLRQAEAEAKPADKNLLLNVALAWVRLAHQVKEVGIPAHSDLATDAPATQAAAPDEAPAESDTAEIDNLGKPLVTH